MSSHDLTLASELVRLTRVASEARDLSTLVCARHRMRVAIRRALVSQDWPNLDQAQNELKDSPSLAAQFNESLHHALETPELGARGPGAHWHGQVLAIPVTRASRAGALVSLPHPIATAMREDLQARFPSGTGIRLHCRLTPQLVAHSMGTRSLYELVEELASGEEGAAGDPGPHQTDHPVPHGQSLGRHYLFALAFAAHPEQLALAMPGNLRNQPGLVDWALAQTERITSDFAARGWQPDVSVAAPQRLREMLSLSSVLSDVREVDVLLDHVTVLHGVPITMLKAELSLIYGKEGGLRITISDRHAGTPLAHSLYRLAPLSPGPDAYRVAVRLASAGAEPTTAEEPLRRAVERAITLTKAAPSSETPSPQAISVSRAFTSKALWSRVSRSPRHPT